MALEGREAAHLVSRKRKCPSTLVELREELGPLDIVVSRDANREIHEGRFHDGLSATAGAPRDHFLRFRSKRSRFMTFAHAAAKSRTNFSFESA